MTHGAETPENDPCEPSHVWLTRRAALATGGTGLLAALLAACGDASPASAGKTAPDPSPTAGTVFGEGRAFRFTVIDGALRSAASLPVENGVSDACQLLGCSYQWIGSSTGDVDQMVAEIYNAISAHVDGIAATLIDVSAFDRPVDAALHAHIPVVAYGADAPGNRRLAYIGQNLEHAGDRMGARIAQLMPHGGEAALFLGAPGAGGIEPRVRGIRSALRRTPVRLDVVGIGASASAAVTAAQTYAAAHPACRGFFGADANSTAAAGATIQNLGSRAAHVVGGGFDLTPKAAQLLASGSLDFVIDQQPYMQGFLAILQLYLYKVSRGLTGAADVDTGARFLDRHTVATYNQTTSRFEGTANSPGVHQP